MPDEVDPEELVVELVPEVETTPELEVEAVDPALPELVLEPVVEDVPELPEDAMPEAVPRLSPTPLPLLAPEPRPDDVAVEELVPPVPTSPIWQRLVTGSQASGALHVAFE